MKPCPPVSQARVTQIKRWKPETAKHSVNLPPPGPRIRYNVTTVYEVNTTRIDVEPPFSFNLTAGNRLTANFNGFNFLASPIARGQLLVRLENMLDRNDGRAETKFVDLYAISKQLWVEG